MLRDAKRAGQAASVSSPARGGKIGGRSHRPIRLPSDRSQKAEVASCSGIGLVATDQSKTPVYSAAAVGECRKKGTMSSGTSSSRSDAQPSFAQKLYAYEPLMMDPYSTIYVNDGSCSAGQGSEGAGRTSESALQEELCAYERSAGRAALRPRQVAHIPIAARHSCARVSARCSCLPPPHVSLARRASPA